MIKILLMQSKQSDVTIKTPSPDENTVSDFISKSYPDFNVTIVRQRIIYLWKNWKILN